MAFPVVPTYSLAPGQLSHCRDKPVLLAAGGSAWREWDLVGVPARIDVLLHPTLAFSGRSSMAQEAQAFLVEARKELLNRHLHVLSECQVIRGRYSGCELGLKQHVRQEPYLSRSLIRSYYSAYCHILAALSSCPKTSVQYTTKAVSSSSIRSNRQY
jgi:hypothetical protein